MYWSREQWLVSDFMNCIRVLNFSNFVGKQHKVQGTNCLHVQL